MYSKKGNRMANKKLNKEVIDSFITNFTLDLEKRYGKNANIKEILYHFIDKGIAPTSRVRDFAIVHDYLEYKARSTGSTWDFLMNGEDIYELSGRKIKSKINDHTLRYCCVKHAEKKE